MCQVKKWIEVNEGVMAISPVCDTDPYSVEEKSENPRCEDGSQMITHLHSWWLCGFKDFFFNIKDLQNSVKKLFL